MVALLVDPVLVFITTLGPHRLFFAGTILFFGTKFLLCMPILQHQGKIRSKMRFKDSIDLYFIMFL
jgi:hypothetical protein